MAYDLFSQPFESDGGVYQVTQDKFGGCRVAIKQKVNCLMEQRLAEISVTFRPPFYRIFETLSIPGKVLLPPWVNDWFLQLRTLVSYSATYGLALAQSFEAIGLELFTALSA